jgi:hypothetical protein
MISPRHFSFLTALLVGGVSLAACGGGDSSDEENDDGKGGSSMSGGGTAGVSGSSGSPAGGAGGTPGSGGTTAGTPSGGNAGMTTGGTGPTGGSSGSSSGGTGGGTVQGCGKSVSVNLNPFGCGFAWGAQGDTGNRSSYLQFITAWIGYEPFPPNNRPNDCDGCGVISELASTDAIPVFYAYYIGYAATAEGFGDCNTDTNLDLCTNGAQFIRDHRQEILDYYASYAAKTYMANPNKPVVWLLDGDFMQYQEPSQMPSPLSVAELGTLVNDMTCAIKTNAPNAVVAINHTPWNGNDETDAFFDAVNLDIVDMVWTTGVGNNQGLINQGADAQEYNATSARYSYLHEYTGKTLFVDTSFGPSQQADSWSNNTADVLNDRIAEGVIAANVTQPPEDYQTRITSLAPNLDSTCE